MDIAYPNFEQSNWVHHLTFHLWIDCLKIVPHWADLQIWWLQKLASGNIGFQNLHIIRLDFSPRKEMPSIPEDGLDYICKALALVGLTAFKTKEA